MKKMYLFVVFFLLLFLTGQMFGYEIYFTSPTNGHQFGAPASVNVRYYHSGERQGYYYYVKLFTHDGEYSSRNLGTIPQWFYLGHGTYSWRIEYWEGNNLGQEFKVAEQSITFYVKYHIFAANNFSGGTIELEGSTVLSGSRALKLIGESVSVGAIDQNDGAGYYTIWNSNGTNNSIWQINNENISGATSRNYSYTVASNDNGATLKAGLRKICNITFSNQFTGTTQTGEMKINGVTYSAPTSAFNVVEQNAISAKAVYQYTVNNIQYTFQNWQNEAGGRSTTFYPGAHKNYTAVYRGVPIFNDITNRNLTFNTYSPRTEKNVKLTWSEHQHISVTKYQIWRITKYNGQLSSPALQTTVNRGTTTWTDYSFYIGPTPDEYQLHYDVRAYYSLEGTYSPESFLMSYGHDASIEKSAAEEELIVKEYSLSNYPNPRLRYS